MTRLPRTEMHHGLRVALFALACLTDELTRPYRKARP